jgi:hypothetical protein
MALGQHGSHGNLFDGVEVEGDAADSPAFDTRFGNEVHVFGAAEGAYVVRLQFSQDGKRWFNGRTLEVDDDGHFSLIEMGVQARYVRLQALRGADFALDDDTREEWEKMKLTATLVAKTTR